MSPLIERDGMGGACVLTDCVPSKTFIASAGGRIALLAAPAAWACRSTPTGTGVDLPTR